MDALKLNPDGKGVYFASDFHLGVPDYQQSREREDKIVQWLNAIQDDAHSLFLLGDIFDFWFEYKKVVPKGYIRLLGKLAELSDKGVNIYLFRGNHDMWMFDYFKKEFKAEIFSDTLDLTLDNLSILVGHGDGLGPGDRVYKTLRKIFRNKFCQWLFGVLPPGIGIEIAQIWSKRSRISNGIDQPFDEKSEYLVHYCREVGKNAHYDYYIFGHRHLVIDYKIEQNIRYLNLGEWVTNSTYAVYKNGVIDLLKFE